MERDEVKRGEMLGLALSDFEDGWSPWTGKWHDHHEPIGLASTLLGLEFYEVRWNADGSFFARPKALVPR